jgi:hypothetical protein
MLTYDLMRQLNIVGIKPLKAAIRASPRPIARAFPDV